MLACFVFGWGERRMQFELKKSTQDDIDEKKGMVMLQNVMGESAYLLKCIAGLEGPNQGLMRRVHKSQRIDRG